MILLLYESPKKKLNWTLESTGVSPVNICRVAQHSCFRCKREIEKGLKLVQEHFSCI